MYTKFYGGEYCICFVHWSSLMSLDYFWTNVYFGYWWTVKTSIKKHTMCIILHFIVILTKFYFSYCDLSPVFLCCFIRIKGNCLQLNQLSVNKNHLTFELNITEYIFETFFDIILFILGPLFALGLRLRPSWPMQ